MIPVPSAEFAAAEARRSGSKPVFRFSIVHHYFLTGLAEGSGTFVNCAYVAPGRIQVNAGAGLASWTSPTLRATVGEFPTEFMPTWTASSPGYNPPVVELRTAATSAGLATAPWTALTSGEAASLLEYYQWRVTWWPVRSWFFDTVEEMDESAMWFLDAYNPEDPYQSYFTDSLGGEVAYIETVRFAGTFRIAPSLVKSGGTLTLDAPLDFSDLVGADHTLYMFPGDGLFVPGHPNFAFAGETHWYKKKLRIEFGYEQPGGRITDTITLYEGVIIRWGPFGHQVDQEGKLQEHLVEIYSKDDVALLLDQKSPLKVGTPAADGTPQPLVMGEILRQAEQLGDETLGDPDRSADFETGDASQLTGVDAGSGGTIEVITEEPYEGNYCLRTSVANAGAFAKGRLELLGASAAPLFVAYLRFVTVPASPIDKNMHFMGLTAPDGSEGLRFWVGSDFLVHAEVNGSWKETSWYLDQDLGAFLRVSIGFLGANPGVLKVWVNGNEVLTWDADWSGKSFKGGFIGPHVASAEEWVLDSDAWDAFPSFYPQLYRVAGGPYSNIGTVYSDGAIKVERAAALPGRVPLAQNLKVRYVGGTVQSDAPANLTKVPNEGAVIFNDLNNKVGGTVVFRLTKDSLSHPVDQVTEILERVGKDDKIDAARFAAAKAATPGDTLGCYFENMPAGDAIRAIVSRCLLLFYMSGNKIKLKAYTGEPPASYELALLPQDRTGFSGLVDMEGVYNKVGVKWGWYERNHSLWHETQDDQAISFMDDILEPPEPLDFSWGNEVGSDNAGMAKAKAEKYLIRSKAARYRLDPLSAFLYRIRLELGDEVLVNAPYLGGPAIFEIYGMTIRMDPPYGVNLRLVRFLGE